MGYFARPHGPREIICRISGFAMGVVQPQSSMFCSDSERSEQWTLFVSRLNLLSTRPNGVELRSVIETTVKLQRVVNYGSVFAVN